MHLCLVVSQIFSLCVCTFRFFSLSPLEKKECLKAKRKDPRCFYCILGFCILPRTLVAPIADMPKGRRSEMSLGRSSVAVVVFVAFFSNVFFVLLILLHRHNWRKDRITTKENGPSCTLVCNRNGNASETSSAHTAYLCIP